jgi:hypothetical protein
MCMEIHGHNIWKLFTSKTETSEIFNQIRQFLKDLLHETAHYTGRFTTNRVPF